MHIPPYHRLPTWQRFLAGIIMGGVIAYCLFIYFHGTMYDELLEENLNLQSEISDLKQQNEALLEDNEEHDEESEKEIVVNAIEITITNEDDLDLDRLIVHQLKELVKQELDPIMGLKIQAISESSELLIASIEDKGFTVDDFTYYFEVKQLIIDETIKLSVETRVSN
ncbi:sporulation membrane protein YtrI [Oceanobacillus halotolerans]|uniref:sporulation membrane protein YtrI n=1 Tax=Oceanobacillus halotolerans TaxID=2663380 RepID=UPI0013DAC30C|nr:sporulation membrane protein YtrI [Oceanobacillus halotolerans]